MKPINRNQQIAHNTMYLYLRKIIIMIISLYTSRLLLRVLGIDDFGLFGLVGSIVVMFISLRSTFSASIQRYLNVDKGQGGYNQQNIFNTGFIIHLLIAILFIIITESVGILCIPHFNIAPEKISTAYWILQFSILSGAVSIIGIPYDAMIIANERFGALAVIQVVDALLRLGFIFLLLAFHDNRVIIYSSLLLGVSLFNIIMCFSYCYRAFQPTISIHRNRISDKRLMIDMSKFAGWNFFGNAAYYLTNEGVNFLLNIFGGIVANAARTISYQVKSSLQNFVGDITIAFLPQTIAAYENDKSRFYFLQFLATKFRFVIVLSLCTPIFIYTQEILVVWLREVPEDTSVFIKYIIFYLLIRTFHDPVDSAFKAANKMKYYQITELIILLSNLPISYIVLKITNQLWSVFLVMSIVEIINLFAITILCNKELGFRAIEYLKKIILPAICEIVILGFLINFNYLLPFGIPSLFVLITKIIGWVCVVLLLSFFTMFNHSERRIIIQKINKKFSN